MDTIFAQATAMGRAGVSVVRISGPLAHEVGVKLVGSLPVHRATALRMVKDREGLLECLLSEIDECFWKVRI